MTNCLVEWIARHMPHYYSYDDTKKYGKVTVTPNEWYRRILIRRNLSIWPYSVGDLIKFTLKVENFEVATTDYQNRSIVYERMGNGAIVFRCDITQKETPIEGEARYTGDTTFFLGPLPRGTRYGDVDESLGIVLFDEDVRSINAWLFSWYGIIAAALVGGCVTLCTTVVATLILVNVFGVGR